jgi:hypothetical protein
MSIVKDNENCVLFLITSARRGFLTLGFNEKTVLGLKEERNLINPELVKWNDVRVARISMFQSCHFHVTAFRNLKKCDVGQPNWSGFLP